MLCSQNVFKIIELFSLKTAIKLIQKFEEFLSKSVFEVAFDMYIYGFSLILFVTSYCKM